MKLLALTTAVAVATLATGHFAAWVATVVLFGLLAVREVLPLLAVWFAPEPLAPYGWPTTEETN